jgi:hypothetical protein
LVQVGQVEQLRAVTMVLMVQTLYFLQLHRLAVVEQVGLL